MQRSLRRGRHSVLSRTGRGADAREGRKRAEKGGEGRVDAKDVRVSEGPEGALYYRETPPAVRELQAISGVTESVRVQGERSEIEPICANLVATLLLRAVRPNQP